MKYRVTYEVRNSGAIGKYGVRTVEVEADRGTGCGDGWPPTAPFPATTQARDLLTADGSLEVRAPLTVEKWDGEAWKVLPWKEGFGYIETPEDEREVLRGTNNRSWGEYRWRG